MSLVEVNFDGLVGPTHNYAGLSAGNVASTTHGGKTSNPRAAALQGLKKMRFVHGLGVAQAVLPPHPRPDVGFLRRAGFAGDDTHVIAQAARTDERLLRIASSASAMWTANAATIAPAPDTDDGRTHLVVANLAAMPHRSLEPEITYAVLAKIFADTETFCVHPHIQGPRLMDDEGAANHTRLQTENAVTHLFGYGRDASQKVEATPVRFPARQTRQASAAVARLLRLRDGHTLAWQQAASGIDAGGFHTDVLAVGNQNVFLVHDDAFENLDALIETLRQRHGDDLLIVRATQQELPVEDAIAAYPFNSQLLCTESGQVIVAPQEAQRNEKTAAYLARVVAEVQSVRAVHYLDVNQSMNNGGGPACLRLRVPMRRADLDRVGARVLLDDDLATELEVWVNTHYREALSARDLADPNLHRETYVALDALTQILRLGSVYPFQQRADGFNS